MGTVSYIDFLFASMEVEALSKGEGGGGEGSANKRNNLLSLQHYFPFHIIALRKAKIVLAFLSAIWLTIAPPLPPF